MRRLVALLQIMVPWAAAAAFCRYALGQDLSTAIVGTGLGVLVFNVADLIAKEN